MRLWRVPYPKFGRGPGLERVAAIAAVLGVDLAGFGAQGAVIVGSNGKGSTAAMTAAVLRQTGASVGLFTSPHLFDLNERFRIDGEDIGDDELDHHWDRIAAAAEVAGKTQELGGFEFLFLIAADWFAAHACAHTVWEAGIGGRLDPVRLIEAKRVALTALDLEHTELLGITLAARQGGGCSLRWDALGRGKLCAAFRRDRRTLRRTWRSR
jgi:dihydrofolate synthase/folylpolyglutamate synthase